MQGVGRRSPAQPSCSFVLKLKTKLLPAWHPIPNKMTQVRKINKEAANCSSKYIQKGGKNMSLFNVIM